jgi:hypothetical protein
VLDEDDALLEYGTRVEVRQRFDGRWSRGFLVEAADADGYLVRREYDGHVLPERIPPQDVRHERRKRNMWWA